MIVPCRQAAASCPCLACMPALGAQKGDRPQGRSQAAGLHDAQGASPYARYVARRTGRTRLSRTAVRAVHLGIGGRYDIVNGGAPNKLDPEQQEQLRADPVAGQRHCESGSGTWTAPLLAEHPQKVRRHYVTGIICNILHRTGFSCRKPRPRHPEPAPGRGCEEFKKAR